MGANTDEARGSCGGHYFLLDFQLVFSSIYRTTDVEVTK